jgi:acetoin utilization protein AcuB
MKLTRASRGLATQCSFLFAPAATPPLEMRFAPKIENIRAGKGAVAAAGSCAAARYHYLEAMITADVMTKDPVTAAADATVGEVMSILHDLDARHLPIVEGRQLVGIISDRDLRAFGASELLTLEGLEDRRERLETPISDVMATDVISLEPETELAEVVDTMLDQRVGAIPIVDRHSDELVGIVSYVDVLRAVRGQL